MISTRPCLQGGVPITLLLPSSVLPKNRLVRSMQMPSEGKLLTPLATGEPEQSFQFTWTREKPPFFFILQSFHSFKKKQFKVSFTQKVLYKARMLRISSGKCQNTLFPLTGTSTPLFSIKAICQFGSNSRNNLVCH